MNKTYTVFCFLYRDGSIIADYDIVYAMAAVATNVSAAMDGITSTLLNGLANVSIANSTVDESYLNDVVLAELANQSEISVLAFRNSIHACFSSTAQALNDLTSDLCQFVTCPLCYYCDSSANVDSMCCPLRD